MQRDSRWRKDDPMKRLSPLLFVVLVVLATLTLAPAASAQCAFCDGERCWWGSGEDYTAALCWNDWCYPEYCTCYTTGHCSGFASASPTKDLVMEYRVASVEIRQNGVLIAVNRIAETSTVVALKKPLHR
jgi:hypothetical protein